MVGYGAFEFTKYRCLTDVADYLLSIKHSLATGKAHSNMHLVHV